MLQVEFSHNEYRFSHSKQPRGYGSWAFEFRPGSLLESVLQQSLEKAMKDKQVNPAVRASICRVAGNFQVWISNANLSVAKLVIKTALKLAVPDGHFVVVNVAP